MSDKTWRRARAAALALLALATTLPEARHGYFPFDEGMLLYGGHCLLRGEGLYEHVRLNCGPAVIWVVSALFALFGESFLAARLLMVVLFLSLVFLFRGILRSVGCDLEADLSALGLIGIRVFLHPHWLMVSYTSMAVLAYFGTLRLLVASRPRWLAAGALAAAAFAFKQNVGILAAILILAALLIRARKGFTRAMLTSGVGSLLVIALMLLGIALGGSVTGFTRDAIATNARFAEFWHMPFPLFKPSPEILQGENLFFYVPSRLLGLMFRRPELHRMMAGSGALVMSVRLIYSLPIAVIALSLAGAFRRREEPGRLLVVLGAAILLLMAWPLATILHWSNASIGWLLAFALLCRGRRVRLLGIVMVILSILGLTILAVALRGERGELRLPIGTIMTTPGTARRVTAVLDFISRNARPEDRIFVIPYAPLYYLVTGRDNPIADDYVIPPWCDEERIAAIAEELATDDVRFVIWTKAELPRFPRFEQYGATLAETIRRDYRLDFASPGGLPRDDVWVRREGDARPREQR